MSAFNPPNMAPQSDDRELELLRLIARYFYDARTGTVPLQINTVSGAAVIQYQDGTKETFAAAADTNAARGAALIAARDAAESGALIVVAPGGYEIEEHLAKNGVNWHVTGAVITRVGGGNGGIWDDSATGANEACVFTVTGTGTYVNELIEPEAVAGNTAPAVKISNTGSDVYISGLRFSTDAQTDGTNTTIHHINGKLRLEASIIETESANSAVWWQNGEGYIRAQKISLNSDGGYAVYGECNAAPTGQFYVDADVIQCLGVGTPVASTGTNTDARIWVNGLQIVATTGAAAGIVSSGAKLYVTAQKLVGGIVCSGTGGEFHCTAQKLETIGTGTGIDLTGASAKIDIGQFVDTGIPGTAIRCTGGSHNVRLRDCTRATAGDGVTVTGGTLRLNESTINTLAIATKNPVVKSGGVLVMQHCVLVAEGARDSIEAPTAQNVVAYGCHTNKAVDANVTVTITNGLLVDADVV
jgi:hypothetical protein